MKKQLLLSLSILFTLYLSGCQDKKAEIPVVRKTVNANWTFNYLPNQEIKEEFVKADFDDSQWEAIAIPHTWSTYETTGDVHPFIENPSERDDPYWYQGWGYYRKKFSFNPELKDRKVFVEFDGVQKYSKVYFNGEYIGDHKGGFTSFYFDVTENVNWEGENVMTVVASNRKNDDLRIPPMSGGNWNIYGGIYRDVRIVMKDKLFIPFQGSYLHEGGTFVTTPFVSKEKAETNIKTYVKNEYAEPANCQLVTTISDPQGNLIQELKAEKSIESGEIFCFDQNAVTIEKPQLWSHKTPNVYRVKSKVYLDNTLVDEKESPLGYRFFHWDYDDDHLVVNGEKINVQGTNRHQEYPWLGDAIPKWIHYEDMKDIVNELGHNFIRFTHYPNDKMLYHLTDTMGVITVEEVPNIKNIDFSEEIQEQNVIEMIRRDRNHPSIFFWSMGNETSDAADSKWAWAEDTTRILHLRKGHEGGEYITHTHENLEMEHILRVTLRGWFDKDDAPKTFNAEPKNGQHTSTETWEHQMARVDGGSVRGVLNKNTVSWLYADHGCDREYLNCALKHFNAKGIADLYRQPKYLYYLTRANYTDLPTVYIHPHFWRSRYIGTKKDIVVDCNGEEVKLFVNDKLVGTKNPTKEAFFTVTFENVPIENGTLKAVATKDGKEYTYEVKTHGKPAKLVLTTDQVNIPADRSGIAILKADIWDENDVPVFDATNTLKWEIVGPATLVGADIYETDIMKYESSTGTGYTVVPVCNVLRATNEAGKIKVIVSSEGLISDTVEITSFQPEIDNSQVIEVALNDAGRMKVIRDTTLSYKPFVEKEIMIIRENHQLKGEDLASYRKALVSFIKSRNRYLNADAFGYQIFLDVMAEKMVMMKGELIADDYNFLVNQYNMYYELEKQVNRGTGATEEAKKVVLKKYADDIIRRGLSVDVEKEKLAIRNLDFK